VDDSGTVEQRRHRREGGLVIAASAATAEPFAFRERLACAARTAGYVMLALPLAIAGLFALLPIVVGVPGPAWRLAAVERRLANSLLAARIPALPDRRADDGRRAQLGDDSASTSTKDVAAFLLVRPAVALAAVVAAAAPIALTLALLWYGADGLASGETVRYIGPWELNEATGVVLWLMAVPAAIVSIAVLDGLAAPLRRLVRHFLVSTSSGTGAVREALAESIGDHTLSVAYWVPDRSVFVDERGTRIELPTRDSGRAWTAVEHEGRRVAAIIHDAELDARPELVRAAAAGAVLALDNERLKADLRARVEELRASRTRIVEASLEARRRLERDLHDGAQQQLVAVSLDLQLIRNRVADDPDTVQLVQSSIDMLGSALSELRELARGIHPAILTDRGLAAALSALIERTPLPVECDAMEERVAPAAEAAAYFVVAEALTNVVKYAQASCAHVRVRREGEMVAVEIEDDGVGGADPAKGSGLRGLEDRVSALDGTLVVDSPPGRGTRVVASIPAASSV
jgi:signal transduction histidine kinase